MDLSEILLQGTHAARPSAATVPIGTLYYATDTQLLWQNVASSWTTYSCPPGVAGGINATVTTATLVGKTMTFTDGVLTSFA